MRRSPYWLCRDFFSSASGCEPAIAAFAQLPQSDRQGQATPSREQGPAMRIPRQQASSTAAVDGVVRSSTTTGGSLPVPGAQLTLLNLQTGQQYTSTANGEGLFRIFPLAPGHYELNVEAAGAASFVLHDLALLPNEVVTLEISLAATGIEEIASRLPRLPELGPAPTSNPSAMAGTYRELRHRELSAAAEHGGNILDIQARGEYAYTANGPGGLRV